MTLKIKKNINETVIEVIGQIDTFTAPVLEKMIYKSADSTNSIVLDICGVEYISDVGIKTLLAAREKMENIGSLTLTGVKENIKDILKANGVADILR